MPIWDNIGHYFVELTLSEKAEAAMKSGDAAFSDNLYAVALEYYRKGVREEPEYAPLRLKCGIAAICLGDRITGESELKEALSISDSLGAAWYWLGISSIISGDFEKALKCFRDGDSNGVKSQDFKIARAYAAWRSGQWKSLSNYVTSLSDLVYTNETALFLTIQDSLYRRDFKSIGALAGRLDKVHSRSSTVLRGIYGESLVHGGDAQEGHKVLEKLIAEEPRNGRVFAALGYALYALGDFKNAEGCLKMATSLAKGAPWPAFILASLLIGRGASVEALNLIKSFKWGSSDCDYFNSFDEDLDCVLFTSEGIQFVTGPLRYGYGGAYEEVLLSGLEAVILSELGKVQDMDHPLRRIKELCLKLPEHLNERIEKWLPLVKLLAAVTDSDSLFDNSIDSGLNGGGYCWIFQNYVTGTILLRRDEQARGTELFREALARVSSWSLEGDVPLLPRVLEKFLREGLHRLGEDAIESELEAREDLISSRKRAQGPLASISAEVLSILNRLLILFVNETEYASAGRQIGALREHYDRPLLVTIMGEFNAGKSSFINAFIGEAVAPMGIIPTTATINYLKYGAKKAIRIIYDDGKVEEQPIDELEHYVDERKGEEAILRSIKVVEILYPLEILKSVNIVDTPGLNAPVPEHEETTRSILEQSDALIWLFNATQAGKSSERDILEIVKSHSTKAVGLVNKIDKLSEADRAIVVQDIKADFGTYFSGIGSVSAKLALKARLKGDFDSEYSRTFSIFEELLNERIFSKSRDIKDKVTLEKLSAVLKPVLAGHEDTVMSARARDIELESLSERIMMCRKEFSLTACDELKEQFDEERTHRMDSLSRDLSETLKIKQGILGDYFNLPTATMDRFSSIVRDCLKDCLSSAFQKSLSVQLRRFSGEIEAEWLTFLGPFIKGSENLFRSFLRSAITAATANLEGEITRSCLARFDGVIDGGALLHLASTIEDEEKSKVSSLLKKYGRKYLGTSFKAASITIEAWNEQFFITLLEGLKKEVYTALSEQDIKREMDWWKPFLTTCNQVNTLVAALESRTEFLEEQGANL
jgi:tetratricopeptide (TPR) repeat protein